MDGPPRVVVTPRKLLLSTVALIRLVVVHEPAHALVLPDWGFTADTTLGFWPEKLTPYVCYGASFRAGGVKGIRSASTGLAWAARARILEARRRG